VPRALTPAAAAAAAAGPPLSTGPSAAAAWVTCTPRAGGSGGTPTMPPPRLAVRRICAGRWSAAAKLLAARLRGVRSLAGGDTSKSMSTSSWSLGEVGV
jgi:hypothetical protein